MAALNDTCLHRRNQQGFTLIELLVTLAVSCALLLFSVPGMVNARHYHALRIAAEAFASDLNLARSEAVRRGTRVTLCKSINGRSCLTTGSWEQGWLVFLDSNQDGIPDEGAASILRMHAPLNGMTLSANTPVRNYISWTGDGNSHLLSGGFQAGTLTLCDPTVGTHQGRVFVLSASGRVSAKRYPCLP